jgi:hypothetical protein
VQDLAKPLEVDTQIVSQGDRGGVVHTPARGVRGACIVAGHGISSSAGWKGRNAKVRIVLTVLG